VNEYPHTDSTSSIRPATARPGDVEPIDELLHSIQQGDAETALRRFPTDSIHGWVTSPPYFHQRDYDADGQLGLEDSIDAYLESLLSVVNQLMRVTHSTGLGWIVLDDSYHDGELAGVPERLHEELRTEGYSIVHHSPWVKPNPKPEPVENRLSNAHEYIIAIAHSDSKHYFNKHGLDDKTDVFSAAVGNTDTDHDAVFPVELPKRLIKASIPEKVCSDCGEPFTQTYAVTDIRDLPDDRTQADRAIELAEKHELSDAHLRAIRSVGLSDTGQSERTQNGSGKNTDEIKELAAEASDVLGSYAREFTQAKKKPVGFEQVCDCDEPDTEPGIVLDPFAGSGTTCVAAKELHRRWAGIELNEDYVAVAESRIGIDVSDPSRLTGSEQETLTDFA
jgi:DNA modification methylase